MPSTVDYDRHYALGPDQCGAPFVELLAVRDALPWSRATILDLGCGQGRDALPWARAGHRVIGVDLAALGVRQMVAVSRAEGLRVSGVVADVEDYEAGRPIDVAIFDRTLHLLPTSAARRRALANAASQLKPGGLLLIVETAANRALVDAALRDPSRWWTFFRRGGFRFAQKLAP